MDIAVIVVSILLGAFIVAPRLLKDNEAAKEILAKINTFQGIIGLVVMIFAVFALTTKILSIGALYGLIQILAILVLLGLGFLLGYGLISEQVLSKSDETQARAEGLRERLQPRQEWLGIAAIGLGLAALLLNAIM